MTSPMLRSMSLIDPLTRSEIKQDTFYRWESMSKSGWATTGRLFEREVEKEQLMAAYERISDPNCMNRELVLITGSSGTGKTAIAQYMKEKIKTSKGVFLQGKWDQFQTLQPYAPFISAFTEFVNSIVKQGDERMAEMKVLIEQATDSDYMLLTDMIPALNKILTGNTDCPSARSADSQIRFKLIFKKFIKAISSAESPIVLFLDDIQWADVASLGLIKTLICDPGHAGFMILGACRGNEVTIDDPLSVMLRHVEDSKASITEIKITNLSTATVNKMICEWFHLPGGGTAELSKIVVDQTGGNSFFIMQYLQTLQGHKLLCLDESSGKWIWDQENTKSAMRRKDIIELVTEKIERLPEGVRNFLKIASCMGAEFDERLLYKVLNSDVSDYFTVAEANGLLELELSNGSCKWTHDKVQEAAYQQIPEAERAEFHLELCRKLWRNLSSDDLSINIFLVVKQLHLGQKYLVDQDEKYRMSALCLQAAEKTVKSSAFATASEYLDLGISLLGPRHWRDNYDISLRIFSASCEIEYCNANFEKMDCLISNVLENTRNYRDGLRAITTKIHAFGAKNRPEHAIETGMEALNKMGERFPTNARIAYIVRDFIRTKMLLRKYTHDQIMTLPIMKDEDHLATSKMLTLLYPYTFISKPEFAPLITFRLIRMTLRYGISPISGTAFASYGMLLCASFNDVEGGYRFGNLAMRLQNYFGAPEWFPRTAVAVYGMINNWKERISHSINPLMAAHRIGLATGDIEFAMLSAALHASCSIHAGRSLRDIAKENREFHELMLLYKQTQMLSMLVPNMQVVLNFIGQARGNPWELSGNVMDEEVELDRAASTKNGSVTTTIHLYQLYIAYYVHEYDAAFKAAKLLRAFKVDVVSSFGECTRYFLEGMTAIAIAHKSNKRRYRRLGRTNLKCLKKLQLLGPENARNKVALMEAELEFLDGNVSVALGMYDKAIELSAKQGITQEHALATERKALAILSIGQYSSGLQLLRTAQSIYEDWGSNLKVERISKDLFFRTQEYQNASSV